MEGGTKAGRFDEIAGDLRFSFRSFRKTPGSTALLIATLALGIGISTAVFSIVDRTLFRPLPYAQPDELVSVGFRAPIEPAEFHLATDYFEWKASQQAFSQLTSWSGASECDINEDQPARIFCGRIEWDFLPTLGVEPFAGRQLTAEDDRPNAAPVALLSYELWQGRYAGARDALGRKIRIDGTPAEIIGVLPKGFELPTLNRFDVLLPQGLDSTTQQRPQTGRVLRTFARLRPGVSPEQAVTLLEPLFQRSLEFVPQQFRREVSLSVRRLRERQLGDLQAASWLLLGATGFLLLIACSNVANLLLARAAGRRQEMAVRAALGASRSRLVRQALAESTALAAVACMAGVFLAHGLLAIFQSMAPAAIPHLATATIDARVLAFAVVASALSALLFGIAPALRPTGSLHAASRAVGLSRDRGRGALVVVQIALSLTLVNGAALLLDALWRLQATPLGFDQSNVVSGRLVLGQHAYPRPEDRLAFYERLEERLANIPGVESFAIADTAPPAGSDHARPFAELQVPGEPPFEEGTGGMVAWRAVSPEYFRVLRIPLAAGRSFVEEDRAGDGRAMVLSESLASRLFPATDPVGRQVGFRHQTGIYTVVGVARDVRNAGLDAQGDPEYYLPRTHAISGPPDAERTFAETERRAVLLIRPSLRPESVNEWIRAAVSELDATLPLTLDTLQGDVRQLSARPRFQASLFLLFGVSALLIAGVGLFSALAYLASRRTSEIGVRIALGASGAQAVKPLWGRTLWWSALGIAFGLAGSEALESWIASEVFHAGESRLIIRLFSAGVLLACVGAAAAWPSFRAARLDPVAALRQE